MSSGDPSWEDRIYSQGRHLNRYPFDVVVSFVYRNLPEGHPDNVRVLEVGCGAGNNLWFLAREGFAAYGIDASRTAIDYARRRLSHDGLVADLRCGDFAMLPWPDDTFDLAIDRGAITCVGRDHATRTICELRRVMRSGGRMLFTPFAMDDTSAQDGTLAEDGRVTDIRHGQLAGLPGVRFL